MIITLRHLRGAGLCTSQRARAVFKRYGLDWSEFCKNGLPEEDFLATGNAIGTRLVKSAHEQELKRGR